MKINEIIFWIEERIIVIVQSMNIELWGIQNVREGRE